MELCEGAHTQAAAINLELEGWIQTIMCNILLKINILLILSMKIMFLMHTLLSLKPSSNLENVRTKAKHNFYKCTNTLVPFMAKFQKKYSMPKYDDMLQFNDTIVCNDEDEDDADLKSHDIQNNHHLIVQISYQVGIDLNKSPLLIDFLNNIQEM